MSQPRTSTAREVPEHWGAERPTSLFERLDHVPSLLADAFLGLGQALNSELDGRVLELVALRVSAARDCLYVWRGHCRIAMHRASDSLTFDEVARVAAGPHTLNGDDAIVVQAVDEFLARGHMSPATGARLRGRGLDLEVPLAAGFYASVSSLMHDALPEAAAIAGLETPMLAAATVPVDDGAGP